MKNLKTKRYGMKATRNGKIEARGYMYDTVSAKGEPVLKINPAVTEYNKTSTVANNTAKVLNEILEKAGARNTDEAL